ncbi:MAG: type IIA topoisomerase (DNA gyrase/topo II topoisomerase IV) A [Desulfobulbaceae bacterium]|jgi:topoisomerase-4 subunit A|nr:MAG: type IIA topoisomerase (DNA gyrase/topo II topoisomerase IV) A [Desulfobulbaceae bacterium]
MNSQYGRLQQLFEQNFLEYSSYVIRERAIPDIHDGLKPVQRRILQTLFNMEDGRFHKVANVVGETMKLHPHGDASIFAALVNLANKEYLIERQGNFGNIYTGDQASAARYIECRLTPLAKEILFNKDLTDFVESYDGRMLEPVTLPAKIPLLLLLGADGIAVGMATKIMPHNFCELLTAQIQLLRNEPIVIYPDFQKKGLVDITHYDHGNGRIRCRARIEESNEKTILIKDIPYGTTTQSLIESVEKAAKSGKIKILSINDYTAEEVEIEINLARGVYAKETIEALYAFTDCEIAITPNLTLIKNNTPLTCTVEEVLEHNTQKLVHDLTRELEIDLGRLQEKLHARLLEQIFIEERLYKEIEEETSYKAVVKRVGISLQPFTGELLRAVTNDDIERLLEIKIKRISRYDINRQQKEVREIRAEIKTIVNHLKDMVGYTINFLNGLLKKYGPNFPRQTKLCEFEEVSVRSVAMANLVVGYQRGSGFLGHTIKAEDEKQDLSLNCSEYDRLLLIYNDGMYKVIPAVDKLFVGHDLAWVGVVEDGLIFNILYRDGQENLIYAKRFTTPKFILEKEYRLFAEDKRSKIMLLLMGAGASAHVSLAPSARAKSNIMEVYFDEYLLKNPNAKGKRIAARVVRKIVDSTGKAAPRPKPQNMTLLDLVAPDKEDGALEKKGEEDEGKVEE